MDKTIFERTTFYSVRKGRTSDVKTTVIIDEPSSSKTAKKIKEDMKADEKIIKKDMKKFKEDMKKFKEDMKKFKHGV